MASQTKQGDLKMFANKVSRKSKKDNSSLTETECYDHYIALDWSEKTMAIARLGRKDTEPKVIDVPTDHSPKVALPLKESSDRRLVKQTQK